MEARAIIISRISPHAFQTPNVRTWSPGGIVIAIPLPPGILASVRGVRDGSLSTRSLQNGAALRLSSFFEGPIGGGFPMQPLHETDNGRTGAPHSAKRHSTCTDEDDEGEDASTRLAPREPPLVFRAKGESRGGTEGVRIRAGMSKIELYICMLERSLRILRQRTMDAEIPLSPENREAFN